MEETNQAQIELYGDHTTWIALMQVKFSLQNNSEVLIKVIQFIQQLDEFNQKIVFTRIRCKHCGIKFPYQKTSFELDFKYQNIVEEFQKLYNLPSVDKTYRIMLDYVQVGSSRRGMKDIELKTILETLEKEIFQDKTKPMLD